MVRGACVLVLALLWPSSVPLAGASDDFRQGRLRALSKEANALLREGLRLSPTFAGMVNRIERSDLIVYVQFGSLRPGVEGATQLVGSSAGTRYVLVTIRPMATVIDLLGRLGHELQHVTEIAEARDVHDDAGMSVLFRRIGWSAGSGRWETDAAILHGRRVLREAFAWRRNVSELTQAR
jgi:hypothetical protein